MATGAKSAQGTLFKIESDSSSGTFATIPECTKINPPNIKFDMLDATSHDSTGGFREFVPGFSDGDNATADFWLIPTNAIHTQLHVDSYAKTKKNFEIIFPVPSAVAPGAGAEIDIAGYIMGFNPAADAGQLLKCSLTVKVTGQPTWV